jgi:hypothetical protein
VSRLGVVGPYFIEDGGETVTVTGNRYCGMLKKFFRPGRKNFIIQMTWFQQDRAKAHTARRSLGILRQMFLNRLVSLGGDIGWPGRSPHFNTCDFFLYLKAEVYKYRPETQST